MWQASSQTRSRLRYRDACFHGGPHPSTVAGILPISAGLCMQANLLSGGNPGSFAVLLCDFARQHRAIALRPGYDMYFFAQAVDAVADENWSAARAFARMGLFFHAFQQQGTRFVDAVRAERSLPVNMEGSIATNEGLMAELKSRITCDCLEPR